MAGDQRPTYTAGQRVWLVLHTGVGGRTPAVVLTAGPARLRVRYLHPARPSRAAHPAERWASVAELAPREPDHPAIDDGYADPASPAAEAAAALDLLSSEPPHPDAGPEWPLRDWPSAVRIERAGDGPATRVTGREVAGGAVTGLGAADDDELIELLAEALGAQPTATVVTELFGGRGRGGAGGAS